MSEQEPQLVLPFQLPTPNIAMPHIELLHAKQLDRSQKEERLATLETEANELRISLGRKALEPTVYLYAHSPEIEQAIKEEEEKIKQESLEGIKNLDLGENEPVFISRQEWVDLDMAGGYMIYRNIVVQRSAGLLFMETNTRSTHRRNTQSQTSQYIGGNELDKPLKTHRKSEDVIGRGFYLEQAELCSWHEFRQVLKEISEELETKQLCEEALGLVADQPMVKGRHFDNTKIRSVSIDDSRELQLVVEYWKDHDEDDISLGEIAVVEFMDGGWVSTARLDAHEGVFDSSQSGRYHSSDNPRGEFKRALSLIKTLLAGQDK